ncbi:MAG: anion permease, partial [Candidatus Bathyarchaeia archaeon]
MASIEFIAAIIGIALIFDFLNGANDAANSISTVVSTRVLRPRFAVAWAAFFNFVAFGIFGVKVAETIGKGIVSPTFVNEFVVLAALLSAVFWTAISTKVGMPISVSHSLVGGLVGAAFFAAGAEAIQFSGFFLTVIFIVIAPLLGMTIGFFFMSL